MALANELQTEQPVIGGQHRQAQLLGHAGADPLVPAAAQGGRRAGGVSDAGDGGSRVDGCRGGWAAGRRSGPTGVPGPTMAGQARVLQMTAECESPLIITARACLVLLAYWRTP